MNSAFPARIRVSAAVVALLLECAAPIPARSGGGPPTNPAADPAAVVRSGDARFTVLTDRLIRLEWSSGGAFEDRGSLVFVNRRMPVPEFTVDSTGGSVVITTGSLVLQYRKGSGRFTADNLSVRLAVGGAPVEWRPGAVDSLNLGGTTRTLDGTNGAKDVTLEEGILSRGGWTLVDDSDGNLFDGSEWDWVTPRPAGERQDWYFFGYGHDYRDALRDFTAVAGRIPMPPRFAFGYWWSRYWTYSDAELRSLVGQMESYGIPIDVLVVDMDWHETFGLSSRDPRRDPAGQMIGWTGYTWNRALFPSPERFLSFARGKGLKCALNLHPASGIPATEERYGEFATAYGFDTSARAPIPFAIEEKKWARAWFDVVLRPLERQGVDFWWLDWQAWLWNRNVAGLGNTWWLNHVFFTDMERQGRKRPILFHRWGGLGNHRYQIGFSGDSWSTWEALAYQPHFTATAGNVGYGYWSHDIGGHVGNDPDPELYLRWLQWGAFSPVVRTHSTKSSRIERRIWKYPDHFEPMREALLLRYRLNPYIYTAAREAYDTGISICRPMYYDHPAAAEAYSSTGQYMFGDDLLVAPVTSKADSSSGLAAVGVWLPPGGWFEWPSGTLLEGGRTVTRRFAVEEIPVYVRAGAVVPMYPQVRRLDAVPDTVVLFVAPGGGPPAGPAGTLYEDDGATNAYRGGAFAVTTFAREAPAPGRLRITVSPREGTFEGMSRTRAYVVELPSRLPPASVTVNGKEYPRADEPRPGSWRYDAPLVGPTVTTPLLDCAAEAVVEFSWTGPEGDGTGLLSGIAGQVARLPKAASILKDEVNLRDQIANAPASMLAAASLATNIAYSPERCAELVREFRAGLPRLVADVVGYPGGDPAALSPIIPLLSADDLVTDSPTIVLPAAESDRPVTVTMHSTSPGAAIRYTLDGSAVTDSSAAYGGPFVLGRTAEIRARSFAPGLVAGFGSRAAFRMAFARSVSYAVPNSPRYDGGGAAALIDGRFGDPDDFRTGWVGFQGDDLSATLDLGSPRDVSWVAIRCLRNQRNWILLPAGISIEVSRDGRRFEPAGSVDCRSESLSPDAVTGVRTLGAGIAGKGVRYVRITAKNPVTLPDWHPSAGQKAWIFADEIVLE